MKKCTKCNKNKDLSLFGLDRSTKDELTSHCKQCRKENDAAYYKANKFAQNEKKRIYFSKKREQDPNFRLKANLRNRLYFAMLGNSKSKRTFEAVGCDIEFLKKHIEKQFQPGMTWSNYGKWHLDHIRPLSSASSSLEIENLFHFTNLQPLWAKDNLRKGDAWLEPRNLS
jgi:hypothetical protein